VSAGSANSNGFAGSSSHEHSGLPDALRVPQRRKRLRAGAPGCGWAGVDLPRRTQHAPPHLLSRKSGVRRACGATSRHGVSALLRGRDVLNDFFDANERCGSSVVAGPARFPRGIVSARSGRVGHAARTALRCISLVAFVARRGLGNVPSALSSRVERGARRSHRPLQRVAQLQSSSPVLMGALPRYSCT